MNDPVSHPTHYTSHPSGIECLQITRHMGFNLGNAIKYIWRADLKDNSIEDLKKAVFYITDEIKMREDVKASAVQQPKFHFTMPRVDPRTTTFNNKDVFPDG